MPLGESMTTATLIAGLFTGAKPANEPMCLVCEYVCVTTSIFCAVSGLARGGIAVKRRLATRAVHHNAFHHLAHLCGGQR